MLRRFREYLRKEEEIKAKAKDEVYKELAAWDRRRKEAEARGEKFTDPPPTQSREKSNASRGSKYQHRRRQVRHFHEKIKKNQFFQRCFQFDKGIDSESVSPCQLCGWHYQCQSQQVYPRHHNQVGCLQRFLDFLR